MKVTIIREIMLHDIELDIPDKPTQEEVNEAIKKVLDEYEDNNLYKLGWDITDECGNERVRVYDDYSGVEIYNSLENL